MQLMAPHTIKKICGADKKNCKCGYRYQKDDAKGPDATCPQCNLPRPCPTPPVVGSVRCRMHSGKPAKGMKSGTFKHGRYSKCLPTRMLAQFEASLKDRELLHLNRDIAVIDARISEQMTRVEVGEAGYVWDALVKADAELIKATARRDTGEMQRWMNETHRLIAQGSTDIQAWRDIHSLLEQRRRFVESETKRQLQLSAGVTLEQVGTYFHALTAAVKDVASREQLAEIQEKFSKLTAGAGKLSAVA